MIDIHPEHARAIIGRIELGLVLIGDDERVTWVNEYASELVGARPESLLGQPINALPLPYRRPTDGTQVKVDDTMIGITQRYDHPAGQDAILMTLERGHALVWMLNALASGVPATLAASGLLSTTATAHKLEAEVSRSRRYANPLSCIAVSTPGADDDTIATLARALRGQLRWVDQLGQWRRDVLLVILPETGEEAARALRDKIARSIRDLAQTERLVFSVGSATWQRGEKADQLALRAAGRRRARPQGERQHQQ